MNTFSNTKFGRSTPVLSSEFITLRNKNGLIARFTPYGARWVSMSVPDRTGMIEDILLGFDALDGYISAGEKYHGAIVGRVCGRIHNACFRLDDNIYPLVSNDVYGKPVRNHLHGGISAFHNRYWDGYFVVTDAEEESAVFICFSEDGEEGYPGNLRVKVTYTLHADNRLSLVCEAITDKVTPVNLTNHAFFNLHGTSLSKDVLSHRLFINSSRIVECDEELIPTGTFFPVDRSSLDFRENPILGASLQTSLFGINQNKGFSLTFALDDKQEGLPLVAELYEETNGRKLSVFTNQPSLQVYTGYFMDGHDKGKGGIPYFANAGIALETQGYPDAVNQPEFPSVLLAPGEVYCHRTDYQFCID